ncbi:class I SAM-dependent methyltransferase [Streptomyces sp. NPDC004610]|uniref:class I SAM-dependent methyltransferase n=1 Tax=unclassified Streptomyces TaxID=2593676 RepID=UPI0033AEE0E6
MNPAPPPDALLLEHAPHPAPHPATEALEHAGLRVRVCRVWAGEGVPGALEGVVAVVLTDGTDGTYGDGGRELPGGSAELTLLRAALTAEVPVLGVGLGARLLDRAAPGGTGAGLREGLREGTTGSGEAGDVRVWPPLPAGPGAPAPLLARFADHAARRSALTATRAFFTPRAADWEARFAADGPRYAAAVARMGLRGGQRALDVGCGSGRALPALRAEVGPAGAVLGVDLTPAMLTATAREGRGALARLLLADACRLPLAPGAVDGVFSAGLINHVPDPAAALAEWARVTRPGGVLLLFHPSGRAERAARHGRALDSADPLARGNLHPTLEATGWRPAHYEDAPQHFLSRAVRVG